MSTDTIDACIRAGRQHHQAGQFRQAVVAYDRALSMDPFHSKVLHNLSLALANLGNTEQAIEVLRRSLAQDAAQGHAWRDLGRMLEEIGHFDEAVEALRKAAELNPNDAAVHDDLGVALCQTGRKQEALAAFLTATRLSGGSGGAAYQNDLALVYQALSRTDEAVAACQEAIARQPDYDRPYANLGSLHLLRGEYAEAFAAYRQALRIKPDPDTHSSILFALHHVLGVSAADQLREARLWNARHAAPAKGALPPPPNSRAPEKTLHVGFVSGDLRDHSVGRFMASWLGHVDRERLHITCYPTGAGDALTQTLRSQSDAWRPITQRMTDADVAKMVRADGIDVLVDLAVHTHGGRPLAFAQRAAPVQVTWLGYCGTTGLDEMDYRLTDPLFDPPGETDASYSERTVHLPSTYWCYAPPQGAGDVQPRAGDGPVVFASLNNYSKVSRPVLETWAEVLVRVPESLLVIHCLEGTQRQVALSVLGAAGVAPERVRFFPMLPMAAYLEHLRDIDIALDSFPFAGGMTTCDALWMGVPVITLRGRTAVGRGGTSILMNVGIPECIAATRETYVEKAVNLARDRRSLSALRQTLRNRMRASPLMDGRRFARDFEAALRKMWQDPRTRP